MGKKKKTGINTATAASKNERDKHGMIRSPMFWLVLIFLFAIFVRIGVHMQASTNDPSYGHPRQDEKVYHGWAESFSEGEMPKDVPFAAPPFYSFVVGNSVYRVFDANPVAAYIFNNLLALLNMYLLFLLGRKSWDTRAGIIAALAYTLYPAFIMLELKVMVTTFYITFALLAIYWGILAREREKLSGYFAAGIIFGLATIARPTFALFLLFYLFWLYRDLKPAGKWFSTGALIVAGFIIPILPVTLTNMIAGDDFVPLTTTAGVNFYIGNHEGATGAIHKPEGFRDLAIQNMLVDAERIAEAETGKQMKPSEVSKYFMGKGKEFIRSNPGEELRLVYRKLRLLLSVKEIGDVWDYETSLKDVSIYRWVNITFAAVLLLGALGIALSWARSRGLSLLFYFLLAFTIIQIFFFMNTRFRLPFAAVLCIFAGIGISAILSRQIERKRIITGVMIALIALVLSILPVSWIEGGGGEHYNRGLHFLSINEPENAKDEFLAELESNPDDARVLAQLGMTELALGNAGVGEEHFVKALQLDLNNEVVLSRYGQFLFELRRWDEAEIFLRKTLELAPNDILASLYLAELMFYTGQLNEALTMARAIETGEDTGLNVRRMQLIGKTQVELGMLEDAFNTLNEALEIDLENAGSWFYFGNTLNRMGRFVEASGAFAEVEKLDAEFPGLKLLQGDSWLGQGDAETARDVYLRGIETEPDSYELYHNLGIAYMRLDDMDAARDAFEKAIQIKPAYYQAYYNLSNVFLAIEDVESAIASLESALEINPGFVPALLNLGTNYAQLADYANARKYWQKVVDTAPGTQAANIAMDNLKALDEG